MNKQPPERDVKEFLARFKGIPGHKVARALTNLTPGSTWTGCPKGYMAERWATAYSFPAGRELRAVTLDAIEAQIKCF